MPTALRTTFNIGRMDGGTSINTIAQHATLEPGHAQRRSHGAGIPGRQREPTGRTAL
ncbi:MAG: hypothetical protein R2838_23430 [Caldilineaceae bacterium]